jgi:predicted peptidase
MKGIDKKRVFVTGAVQGVDGGLTLHIDFKNNWSS